MLENPDEARRELQRIRPPYRRHPDVLELDWVIGARRAAWRECLTIARTLIEVAPDRASGYLHQAYALRRVPEGGLQSAWEALRPAADRFPSESLVVYNLACYACQMGDPAAARQWLARLWKTTTTPGEKEHWLKLALGDRDLAPLWPEIRALGETED
jgi:predicted Zn-dependent protease